METLRPNEKEIEVLTLFYNRFYGLFDEIVNDDFFNKETKKAMFSAGKYKGAKIDNDNLITELVIAF